MGHSYRMEILEAGRHLLEVLRFEGCVRYSRFYDGTDATENALVRGMGYGPELAGLTEDDYVPERPADLIDLAVKQLERKSIVKTTVLQELLADENPDYLIELTDEGRSQLATPWSLRFWDAE